MFLARIYGTLTSTVKHATLENCRFVIGRRLESDLQPSGEPLVFVDTIGARHGATVLISTDNEPLRISAGNSTPARLLVVGNVDHVYLEGGPR